MRFEKQNGLHVHGRTQDESAADSCHYLDVATLAKHAAATNGRDVQPAPGNAYPPVIMSAATNYDAAAKARRRVAGVKRQKRKAANGNCCIT